MAPAPSSGEPELIPVAVVAGFFQSIQMSQAGSGPELARAFAAALPLPTRRFHRAAANGPALAGQRLVVHPAGVTGKVVLFAAHHLAAAYYTPEQLAAWAPVPPDAARWQARLAKLHTLVAESEGVLAGFAAHTDAGHLDFLFTHPAFARRGVASRLYQRIESALRAVGAPRVTAHVSLVARPFFDRHGFLLDAEESVECRGAYLRRFAMHKPLREVGGAAAQ